jgi:hypothetical protein
VGKVWKKRKILKVVSVCVCGFISQNAEIEKLKEQGLWKEELEPTGLENQAVNSCSKKCPVWEE